MQKSEQITQIFALNCIEVFFMYKVTKCKPWVEDLQKHCDEMEKSGWTLISHSSNSATAGFTFIWYKE